jgi:hypothetical protein
MFDFPLERLGSVVVSIDRPANVKYDAVAVVPILDRIAALLASDEALAALLGDTYTVNRPWFSTSTLNAGKDAPVAS